LAKLSTIDIAAKQRHMFLLVKVKENKALTRAELVELKRYERQTAGQKIAKARITSTKPSTKSSTKRSTKQSKKRSKKSKKKAKKKRKARPPVDEAEIRRLGLECETRTEADAAVSTRRTLAELFRKYPELRKAWDRGRFLRNLRDMARTGVSISNAAKKLGFANGQVLRTMIDEDEEVGDLWNQTKLEIDIDIRSSIIEAAKDGKADAIRAVESFLLDEREQPEFDPSRITILQLSEITGKARTTILEWHKKFGMPRNTDKTFDMGVVWAWREEFLLKKAPEGKEQAVILDPLKAMKAEKLRAELARHRNEVLDRNEVMISLVAWAQHIVSFCERGNVELSRLCVGQPREKIIEIHKRFFQDLHAETARVPKELHLPDDKEKELVAFMNSLKPKRGGPGHGT